MRRLCALAREVRKVSCRAAPALFGRISSAPVLGEEGAAEQSLAVLRVSFVALLLA